MLLADFICFLILASYSQTPSFGPVTGVGGSGCDSRLEYSHSDGEQEDAKWGSKGWNRCVKLLSKNTAVRPASGHVEWGNSPFPRSPKRGRTSSKPQLMNVFSQTLHTAHCSVQSCQNHVVMLQIFFASLCLRCTKSQSTGSSAETKAPGPRRTHRRPQAALGVPMTLVLSDPAPTCTPLHHPLSPQALAFTADAFNTNCFLPGCNISQRGDIWHMLSIEL